MHIIMIALIILNFWILGVGRIQTVIKILALQGFVISLIPMTQLNIEHILLGFSILILKAIVFPKLLSRTINNVHSLTEEKPYISFAIAPFIGALFLFSAHAISPTLATPIFIIFVGIFLLLSRKKAVNQIISFLVFENGIFVLGFIIVSKIPIVMEMAILFDVLAAILVMRLSVNHIHKFFTHTDVEKLNSLKG